MLSGLYTHVGFFELAQEVHVNYFIEQQILLCKRVINFQLLFLLNHGLVWIELFTILYEHNAVFHIKIM